MPPSIRHNVHMAAFSLTRPGARFVHSSARRNLSIPSASTMVSSQLSQQLSSQLDASPPSKSHSLLARLPTSSVLRSYLITRMSSSPAMLALCFALLRQMLESRSYLLSIERNPLIQRLLKSTFYAQFCAGETQSEVVRNATTARGQLGYDAIMLEYALEVLGGGSAPTAAETTEEIAVWRKGMLESVQMANEGDYVGLKWSGLGRHALALLQANEMPTAEMLEAIYAACDAAAAKNVALLPGAEEEITNQGLEKWNLAFQKKYNTLARGRAVVYTTYQCYLRDVPRRIALHAEQAARENFIYGVKLVRGAYMTFEDRAAIWADKEATDACYDACATSVLKREWTSSMAPSTPSTPFPQVNIILATHNLSSLRLAQSIRAHQLASSSSTASLPHLAYIQLWGMADEVSQELVHAAQTARVADPAAKVAKCTTWGTTAQCLNFLLRRATENKQAAMRTEDTRRAMGLELWRRFRAVLPGRRAAA